MALLTISVEWYFLLSITLFAIGVYGIMTQVSGIKILMCIEIMLNAANINFAAFSSFWESNAGFIFVLFSIAVAAAEAAVGLAILVNVFRQKGGVDVSLARSLRW